ncbi:MAG: 4-hydroxy-tetrahydrodipicolinate reductase [Planctomycetota bacterium]|nr:MAG: 4-hydroxy-tetrahydrodipicolinate reductase [Planctomycetota bacterium]
MPFSIVISGVTGRVGRALAELARADPDVRLAGALASESSAKQPLDADRRVRINDPPAPPVDAVIDFSTSSGCARAIRCALDSGAALVVGTTGLADRVESHLRDAAASIPMLVAANTSLGACVLIDLASRATRALGDAYDVSLIEAHRAGKRDAPSGTALALARAVRDSGGSIDDGAVLSLRAGDTVGEHTVRFDATGETLQITHRATDRRLFAAGALRAAKWLAGRPPGRYAMSDVLGL